MRLYTRTGDDGTTGLIGGARARKDALQIEAYGTADELNAHLGVIRAAAEPWLDRLLAPVQDELFVIGSHLALGVGENATAWRLPELGVAAVSRLEREIDAAEGEMPRLATFILPGGTPTAAALHVARTVCRRAERVVIALDGERRVEPPIIEYVNRLSDWLFAYARLANHRAGVADVPWRPK